MTTAPAGPSVVTSEQASWFTRAFGALVTNVGQRTRGAVMTTSRPRFAGHWPRSCRAGADCRYGVAR
jgi:hypothetical protein